MSQKRGFVGRDQASIRDKAAAQSSMYTGTQHREWLLFLIRVNPSLIRNNTFEVMQTATYITKPYLNILYF